MSRRSIQSDRLRAAIKSYGAARHELLEALQSEAPGRVVVTRHRAFAVATGPNGQPSLLVGPVARVRPSSPSVPTQENPS